jgi:deoxycytidine triphosphate deaminase
MVLGIDKVMELIKTKRLVEDLDESNTNLEGCGVDLRIGEIYEMSDDKGFLFIETRKTPNFKLIAKYEKDKSTKVVLKPRRVYSATTIETINTPENLMGWFIPRSTFYKCGIVVQGVRTDPGYRGKFSFVLINNSDKDFEIEMGARIANMVFHRIDGESNLYKGQWQGGRAFIGRKEKQTKHGFKKETVASAESD